VVVLPVVVARVVRVGTVATDSPRAINPMVHQATLVAMVAMVA
jgi:hypothetical protein